jgi:hypothetical protein
MEDTVIPKKDLKDGQWYRGRCRHAVVAVWDLQGNRFWYIRHKFGQFFMEAICHPEDDDGYDLFVPREVIPWA